MYVEEATKLTAIYEEIVKEKSRVICRKNEQNYRKI
jgi:hypothetical protein